jgi:hypothetical protein
MFAQSSLALSSQRLFNDRIDKLLPFFPSITSMIAFPSITIQVIQQLTSSPSNRHSYISACIALFSHSSIGSSVPQSSLVLDQWKHLLVLNSQLISEHYHSHTPTFLQQLNRLHTISWHTVISTYLSLPSPSLQRLLLAFYSLIPPLRADFFALFIFKNGTTSPTFPNYITIFPTHISLTIRDFKTSSKYGSIVHEKLPEELEKQIREYLKDKETSFVFTHSDNTPFTRHSFTVWANRIFKNIFNMPVTISTLRHLYISSLPKNLSITEKDRISKLMGHSIDMQRAYKWDN